MDYLIEDQKQKESINQLLSKMKYKHKLYKILESQKLLKSENRWISLLIINKIQLYHLINKKII